VGEDKSGPFQLSFNSSLRVDFQGPRLTSDGGLIPPGARRNYATDQAGPGERLARFAVTARGARDPRFSRCLRAARRAA
jgi:hypothetical protein